MGFSGSSGWFRGYLTWIGAYAAAASVIGVAVAAFDSEGQRGAWGEREAVARAAYQECIEAQAETMMQIEDRAEMITAIDAIQDESCNRHLAPYMGEQPYPDQR